MSSSSTLTIHIGSTHHRASHYDSINQQPKILVFSNGNRHFRVPLEDTLIQSQQERSKLRRKYLRHLIEEAQMYFQNSSNAKIGKILEVDWYTSAWLAYMDHKWGLEQNQNRHSYNFMAIKWTANSFQIKFSRVVNGLMSVANHQCASSTPEGVTPLMTTPTIETDTLKFDKELQIDDILLERHIYNHGEYSTEDVQGIAGEKIDELLVDFLRKEFKKKYHIDVAKNQRAMIKLKKAAEVAKRTLSNTVATNIQIESLAEDIDFSIKLSLPKYEMLISSCVNRVIDQLTAIYKQIGQPVHYVALVGGSANIPIFKKKMTQFFDYYQKENPPKILDQIPPEEVTLIGASIHTQYASNQPLVQKLKYTPATLGVIHPVSRTFVPVIEKGSQLPVENTITLEKDDSPPADQPEQSSFSTDPNILSVVEERSVLLAEFPIQLEDSLEVTFKVDAKAVLTVSCGGQELRVE